jgi:thioredoxin-dependent peroxiredoxin
MAMVMEGDKAPAFTLNDKEGKAVSLSDFKGRFVVLYFYPKDDTPGCTVEACSFRDAFDRIEGLDAVVLGVSPDDAASHRKFATKYGLPFTLLSDPEHAVAEAYGAWGEKSNYGKKYFGILRSTFVIGPDGSVRRTFAKVKPEGHSQEVYEALTALKG